VPEGEGFGFRSLSIQPPSLQAIPLSLPLDFLSPSSSLIARRNRGFESPLLYADAHPLLVG